MPSLHSGKILLSGANGYLAVEITKQLLEQGFSVRGTVRTQKSVPYLQQLFKPYGDRYELVTVPDITADGAFDEAVKGVSGVIHAASPFRLDTGDPSEIIDPTVKGTTSILFSVLNYGTQVLRFVLLSSIAAIVDPHPGPIVFDDNNWSTACITNCREKGRDASQMDKYAAAKTLAERALWEFGTQHKDNMQFDLVALNPVMVYGPFDHEVAKPEDLNASLKNWYTTVVKGAASKEDLTNGFLWVDVRDVAAAHILALQKEEAGGGRFGIHAGPYKWQEFVNLARELEPALPAGNTDFDSTNVSYPIDFDASGSKNVLGLKYKDKREMVKDALVAFKKKGWL
ncbi:NAD(P)-binding protein [Trametopsis cervina]|nr:NAD(P)-binding protein [Trametopsis cervina]